MGHWWDIPAVYPPWQNGMTFWGIFFTRRGHGGWVDCTRLTFLGMKGGEWTLLTGLSGCIAVWSSMGMQGPLSVLWRRVTNKCVKIESWVSFTFLGQTAFYPLPTLGFSVMLFTRTCWHDVTNFLIESQFNPTLGVSKCPWARHLTPNCSWRAGWCLAWQPIAVGVWMCVWMGEWVNERHKLYSALDKGAI